MRQVQYLALLLALLLPLALYAQNDANKPVKVIKVVKVLVRASPGVLNGTVVHKVNPAYPEEARAKHIQGPVILRVLVDPAGNVASINVQKGDPILAEAAQKAVQQWKFKPFTVNGEPVEVESTVTLNFSR